MLKGVGKVYLQTAIDCNSRYAWAHLYANKLPVTAVQLLNNDVLPTFEAHGATIEAVLSDNGREFCGREDQHPHQHPAAPIETVHGLGYRIQPA